ncbi:hypothetical protein DERP_005307 [Dermatophagoides pteronyssinus]|uniref:Uncharacterized protein n=1 Tax=Dermatophagoides pteronyssinus TaxID=6956 RepID=A0ABQ8JM95_DERPT|nr:hypothetical protein DERP_005307 [Dermatophagoides pteronyssinus]
MHTCNEKLPNTEEIKMIINMEKRTEMKCNEKRMNKSNINVDYKLLLIINLNIYIQKKNDNGWIERKKNHNEN